MAKKDKKKSKKKDNPGADAVGAVRTAVEKTFHATADSVGGRAESTRTRAQDLVDEVAGAAVRLREMIEQVGVLEDLKKQVESLGRRVQALEGRGASKPTASKAAASSSRSTAKKASGSTTRKPAAKRSTTARKSASSSSRAKPAASRKAASSARSTAKPTTSSSTPAKKPS